MNQTSDLRNFVSVAGRHKKLILIAFAIVFALAIVAALLLPPAYTAQMEIMVRPSPPELEPLMPRATVDTNPKVSDQEVNSEVALLSNPDLYQMVVQKAGLVKPRAYLQETDSSALQRAVRTLAAKLKIRAVRNSNVIEVKYSSRSPQEAETVVQAVRDVYLAIHARAQQAPGATKFFATQADQYQQKVDQAQDALTSFVKKEKATNLDQQSTQLTQTLSEQRATLQQTEAKLVQARAEVKQATAAIAALPNRVSTARKSQPNQYAIDHLTTLLAELRNRRTLQTSKFVESDRIVKESDQEIAITEEALNRARNGAQTEETTDVNPVAQALQQILESRRVEASGLEAECSILAQQIESNEILLNHLTSVAAPYAVLTTNAKLARDNYAVFAERRDEAQLSELLNDGKLTGHVVVAVPPTVSVDSFQSRFGVNLVLGLFVAVFASILAVLTAEKRTNFAMEVAA